MDNGGNTYPTHGQGVKEEIRYDLPDGYVPPFDLIAEEEEDDEIDEDDEF